MHPSKRKGDRAELEVQAIIRGELGINARRALGAGRLDDMGDIWGLPDTVIQVVDYKDVARAISEKLPECERQQRVAEATFGATWVRRRGGAYVVAQTPRQWCDLWREASA